MTAPNSIRELVEKFDQHRAEYRQHKNETELRREFLDPFFAATDGQIDRLVYELYGLSEEEIRIVEGG